MNEMNWTKITQIISVKIIKIKNINDCLINYKIIFKFLTKHTMYSII